MPARVRVPPEVQAELAAKARALVERLRAGSTDLTAEGAATLERVDPTTRIGLDAAMEQGWEPMEAKNISKKAVAVAPHSDLSWTTDSTYGKGYNLATQQMRPDSAKLEDLHGSRGRDAFLDEKARRAQQTLDSEANGWIRQEVESAQYDNPYPDRPSIIVNENPRLPRANPNPHPGLPADQTSWNLNENIPGLAAGTSAAAAAAYALAPREAQAAPPQGPQTEDKKLKTGASFGLFHKPAPGVPDPFKDRRAETQAMQMYEDAGAVAGMEPGATRPELQGPGIKPMKRQTVRTLEQVANSPQPAQAFEQYLQGLGFETQPGVFSGLKNTANAVELLVHPAVRMVQDEAGRPLVEAVIERMFRKQGFAGTAGKELLARSAGMLLGGPAVLEKMDEKRKLKGVTELEDSLGEWGTAAALSVAQQAGELPLFVIGPGKWLKLGETAAVATMSAAQKLAVKGAGAVLGGARAGALSAIPLAPRESEVAPGMTIGEGAVGGALLGGAFEALFAAARRARPGNWAMENKLAEFAREDAAGALKGQLVSSAAAGRRASQLSTKLDDLKQQKFQMENAPQRIFNRPEEQKAQPVRAILTKEGWQQMNTEVLSFPAKAEKQMSQQVFGEVQAIYDPTTGPALKYIERFDANGQPVVKIVPATVENITRARVAAKRGGFDVTSTDKFLAQVPQEIAHALHNPTGFNTASMKRAAAESYDAALEAALRGGDTKSGRPPKPPGERTQVSTKRRLTPAEKDVQDAATSPTMMVGTSTGKGWKHSEPTRGPKVTVQHVEEDVPWMESSKPDAVEILVDSKGEMHARPVHVGDTALPEDLSPATQIEDISKAFEDTRITANGPTEVATVADLRKLGFNKDSTGGSGIGGGSYKGSKPEDVPVGFIGGRGGGGNGGKKPPIAGGPLIPELPPGAQRPDPTAAWADRPHADLEEAIKYVSQTLNATRKVSDVLAGTFVSNHLRGPTWWSAWKTSYQASQILQRTSDEIFQFARKTFKGKVLDEADKALYDFFKRGASNNAAETKMAWANVEKHIPENLRAKAKEFSFNMLAEKEALDGKLRALGYTPEDLGWQREAGLVDAYLTRRYMLYAMPQGRYGKSITSGKNKWRLDEGIDFIRSQLKETNPEVTPSQVTEMVLDLLKESDPLAAIKQSAAGSRYSPLKSLIKREEIPKPIRNLLGEIESGQAGIAMSLSTQRALVARFELLHDLHAKGPMVWSDGAVPALDRTYKIPDNRAFGPLAGKYVDRDIFEGVTHLPKADVGSHEFVRKVLGFTKGNQTALGGVGPLLNSTFGNLWSGVLAGGLDIGRVGKSAKAFKTALRALIDYSNDPSGFTGAGALVIEARRHGADFFGFGHEEIGSPAARKFLEEIEREFPKGKTDLFDVMGKLNDITFKQLSKLQEKGGWLLDMNDRLFRMQSYIVLREKFLADLAKRGKKSTLYKEGLLSDPEPGQWVEIRNKFGDIEGYTKYIQQKADEVRLVSRGYFGGDDKLSTTLKGVSNQAWGKYYEDPEVKRILEAAAKMAARRINQSFWNPSFIAKPLDRLRKSAMGVITPYATASFETARINGMLMQRLAKEPDLWFRLAGAAAVTGAAVGANGLLRHLNDISDEQVAEAMAQVPEYQKGYRPATSPMAWRDSKGRIQLWDYTRQFDPLRYFVGAGTDPMWARFAFNMLGNAAEGGAAEGPLQGASAALGLTSPQPGARPPGIATPRAEKVLRFLFDTSLLPGAARNVYNAARLSDVDMTVPLIGNLGARGGLEPQLTTGQAVAKGLGISNIVPMENDSLPRAIEMSGRIKKIESEMRTIINSNLPDDEKERRLDALAEEIDKVSSRY